MAEAAATEWIRGIYTKESPQVRLLPAEVAWSEARAFAARTEDAVVLAGKGNSMNPLYPDGTVLVVARKPFSSLVRGMTVVYRNRQNRSVAHVLVAKTGDGWRVTGLNNRKHDGEGVHADNLVGVVVAAFRPVAGRTVALQ